MSGKKKLVVGTLVIGTLGFAPMIISKVSKGKKQDYLTIHHSKNKPFLKTKTRTGKKTL